MVIPSLTDPSVAPPGKHVMSCFVQYAPYKLKEGTWDEKKEEFGDNVINTIAEYAPNIKDIIIGRQVVTPLDLEREAALQRLAVGEGRFDQGDVLGDHGAAVHPAQDAALVEGVEVAADGLRGDVEPCREVGDRHPVVPQRKVHDRAVALLCVHLDPFRATSMLICIVLSCFGWDCNP